jgi:hypothetical protein
MRLKSRPDGLDQKLIRYQEQAAKFNFAAVAMTTAVKVSMWDSMIIFMLISSKLTNYCLFFNQRTTTPQFTPKKVCTLLT